MTAISSIIGCDKASLREVILKQGNITAEEFDRLLDPNKRARNP
jgi:fumarate hydratase class II